MNNSLTRFASWKPDSNPLIARWKSQPTRLSLQAALRLAFGLGMLSLAATTWTILHATRRNLGAGLWIVFWGGWLAALVAPVITAISAAALTRLITRPERFDLYYLTPLPNERLINALVFHALYRQRVLYVALIVLMPCMVLPIFHQIIALNVSLYQADAPPYQSAVVPTLLLLATLLGLWGMNGVAAAAGVRMALMRRHGIMAALTAPGIVLLIMVSPCMCCAALLFFPPETEEGLTCFFFTAILGWPLIMLIGPYAIATSIIRHTAWLWSR